MRNKLAFILVFVSVSWASSGAQEALDGPNHVFQDALLENLSGQWQMTGKIQGRDVTHTIAADWVLNHQFLRIHEKDTATTKEGLAGYEAVVMVGYDNASERYVAHW